MSTDAAELTFIRPDPVEHRQAVFDLTAKAFSSNGYWNWTAYCRNGYIDNSHYDWQASTLGLLDGQVVTHWGVWRHQMRIGRARVRMAGIGAVAAHGDFRKRGLMARTAPVGCEAARAAGYDVSVLFGIRDFYHRFGYVRAWPYRTYVVPADELTASEAKVKLRPFPPRHRDDLAALYNRQNARLTCTMVRPTFTANNKGWEGYMWQDADGKAEGYVIVSEADHEQFILFDHAGETPQVLDALAALAKRRHGRELRCRDMHHHSDLARALRRGTCCVETHYVRSGEAMIRTLNLATTLTKICGELSARLKHSHLADWKGDLLIADAREKVMLTIDRSSVSIAPPARTKHAIRGGEAIAQLLIGTDDPGEIVEAAGIRLTGDAKQLITVLMPHQSPAMSAWDHF